MILCGGSDSGELKSPGHDFKYLYWTISQIISANLFTCKGTHMTDWVGRTSMCVWVPYVYIYISIMSTIRIHLYIYNDTHTHTCIYR